MQGPPHPPNEKQQDWYFEIPGLFVGCGTGPGGSVLLPKWLACTLEFAKLKRTDSQTVWLRSPRSKRTKQDAGRFSVRDF